MSSELTDRWFSAAELAKYGKQAGLPGSARGCAKKAQRENWPSRSVPGKGGKDGVKTLYQPPLPVLAAINVLGCPNSTDSMPAHHHRIEQPLGDYVAIPLYNGVKAAAGSGAIVEHEHPDDMLMFKDSWVRHELGASPKDLYLIRVSGDSMEPTLRAGDVILINRQTTQPDREGVYILRMNGMLLVKRLQALPGGMIRVISDNAAFTSFDVTRQELDGNEIAVIGRVVWLGRRM